jgi:hypothetical protein
MRILKGMGRRRGRGRGLGRDWCTGRGIWGGGNGWEGVLCLGDRIGFKGIGLGLEICTRKKVWGYVYTVHIGHDTLPFR